ncbi:MAG: hypothetical protein GC180_02260 [Bacteroidetes bacterium]|nr:hypothetical protein [Bacteroidota bacterium]
MTTLTDVILAAFIFNWYLQLRKLNGESGTRKLLLRHFLFLSIATFLGGVMGHGFLYVFGPYGKLPGFALSIIAVFMLELAVIRLSGSHLKPGFYRALYSLALAISLSCLTLSFWSPKFVWVAFQSTFGLLFVTGGLSWMMIRKRIFRDAFVQIWRGIAFSIAAALVFAFRYDFHVWFNHKDFSHIFLILSSWFIFKGAKNLLENTKG